jgi:hypothetical protein
MVLKLDDTYTLQKRRKATDVLLEELVFQKELSR